MVKELLTQSSERRGFYEKIFVYPTNGSQPWSSRPGSLAPLTCLRPPPSPKTPPLVALAAGLSPARWHFAAGSASSLYCEASRPKFWGLGDSFQGHAGPSRWLDLQRCNGATQPPLAPQSPGLANGLLALDGLQLGLQEQAPVIGHSRSRGTDSGHGQVMKPWGL